VNFNILLEKKTKNCDTSATVRIISKKINMMTNNVSLKCMAVKNFNFKIPSRHLDNRKIVISHDDAEWVSEEYLPS